MSLIQRGDALFFTTTDGGEINVTNGVTEMTQAYESAVTLCLGGGNIDDANTVETKKYEWMGNEDEIEEYKLRSRFNNILASGRAITSQFIRDLGEAAALDILECFSGVGATAVNSTVAITGKNKLEVYSQIEMRNGDFEEVKNEVFV